MKRLCFMFVLIVFAMAMAVPAIGEEPQKAPATTKEVPLEEKVKALEKKVEDIEKITTKEDAKLKEDKKERAVAYYRDGFFMETPDKKFRLQIGGVLHFDTRVFEGNKSATSFDIRRARYDIRGTHYRGDVESIFRIQIEMADTPYVRNVYWMFKFRPEFNLQIGQFKIPGGGADYLTEEAQVNFIEYSTAEPVAPFFDRGINIHSFWMDGIIQANLGMFTGVGSDVDVNHGDYDNHKNYAGRLMLVPFKKSDNPWLKGMHIAGSYETGDQSIKTARGETRNRTENYESRWYEWKYSYADIKSRKRYGLEYHWLVGPATLSYEYNVVQWEGITAYEYGNLYLDSKTGTWKVDPTQTKCIDGKTGFPATCGPTKTIPNGGSYQSGVHQIWVSYFLTGEQKTMEDVFFAWRQPKPKKNFSLKNGTWGAWEVVARYVYHDTDQALFQTGILEGSNRGYSVTGGLRWIWNPKCRIMFDANYLKSIGGDGIVTDITDRGVYRAVKKSEGFKETETAFLLRFILTP